LNSCLVAKSLSLFTSFPSVNFCPILLPHPRREPSTTCNFNLKPATQFLVFLCVPLHLCGKGYQPGNP
jgi:hypothetical protein